jgi:hypothetical protein
VSALTALPLQNQSVNQALRDDHSALLSRVDVLADSECVLNANGEELVTFMLRYADRDNIAEMIE